VNTLMRKPFSTTSTLTWIYKVKLAAICS
jgi:hypothetical protein